MIKFITFSFCLLEITAVKLRLEDHNPNSAFLKDFTEFLNNSKDTEFTVNDASMVLGVLQAVAKCADKTESANSIIEKLQDSLSEAVTSETDTEATSDVESVMADMDIVGLTPKNQL
jgi:hypothetical protein